MCKNDVFVSYAHADDEPDRWVTHFVKRLLAERNRSEMEIGVWWDRRSLPRSGPFPFTLREAVQSSCVMCNVVSTAYMKSNWCGEERETFLSSIKSGPLATASAIWSAKEGNHLRSLRHDDSVVAIVFRPDGNLVATGSFDNTVKVWDAQTGELVGVPLRHLNGVTSLAFRFDGRQLITGSIDRTARIWNVPKPPSIESVEQLAEFVAQQRKSFEGDWRAKHTRHEKKCAQHSAYSSSPLHLSSMF